MQLKVFTIVKYNVGIYQTKCSISTITTKLSELLSVMVGWLMN